MSMVPNGNPASIYSYQVVYALDNPLDIYKADIDVNSEHHYKAADSAGFIPEGTVAETIVAMSDKFYIGGQINLNVVSGAQPIQVPMVVIMDSNSDRIDNYHYMPTSKFQNQLNQEGLGVSSYRLNVLYPNYATNKVHGLAVKIQGEMVQFMAPMIFITINEAPTAGCNYIQTLII